MQRTTLVRSLSSNLFPSVETTSRQRIPTHSHAHNIPLTVVDVHLRHEQLPFAYFFDETLDADLLTTSLAKVLRAFPQTGGRLDNHVAIQCTKHDTVPLSFGKIDMTLTEWQREQRGHVHQAGTGHPTLLPLFDPLFVEDNLLTIRVTYFSCGATCIGVNLNHALGDTASCVQFVKSWGQEMRNESAFDKICNIRANASCSGMMTADLACLMGLGQPRSSNWTLLPFLTKWLADDESETVPVNHEYVRLCFSPTLLQAIKRHGMAACNGDDSFVSTNDLVTAYGWLMKRRLSRQSDYNISVVVNLRGRFGIHPGLFGNGITHVVARLPETSEIGIKVISLAAMSIRKSLTTGLLDIPERLAQSKRGKTVTSVDSTSTFSTTSWGQFPLWKIHFGNSALASFHGQPAHPLPVGRTFSSVISPEANGGCVYEMLLPSDKAQEAKLLHQQLTDAYMDWYWSDTTAPA